MRFAGVSPSAGRIFSHSPFRRRMKNQAGPPGCCSANLIRDSEALEERVFAFVATTRSPAWRSRDCSVAFPVAP